MIDKKQTDIFAKIIVMLIPPSLVFSIVIMELISFIIVILFIFQSTKKDKKDLFLNKFFLIFFSFYIICVISSLMSDYVVFSLKNSLSLTFKFSTDETFFLFNVKFKVSLCIFIIQYLVFL